MIDRPNEQPDLFASGRAVVTSSPPCEVTRLSPAAIDRHKRRLRQDLERANHSDDLRRFEPVAIDVASRHPTFTMADVRDELERIGWLTGQEGRPNPGTDRMEKPRELSFLGALLPGLARIGLIRKLVDESGRTVYETSARDRANGNKQALWQITERGENARQVSGSSLAQLAEIILAYRESGVRHG